MSKIDSFISNFLLIASFASFYLLVEYFFWSQAQFSNLAGVAVVIIISFLNLIPAGIFAFAIVSVLPRRLGSSFEEMRLLEKPPLEAKPRIALLYSTYNDFDSKHAEFDVLEAQKGNFPFFILDDSTDSSKKEEVTQFTMRYGCYLLRRKHRHGYKAGAINEWIEQFGKNFDYFFVLDSDSRVSCRAIAYCSELARRDRKLAIIQSKTLTMTSNPSRLTRSAVTIQHAYMEIIQKAMRILGTSPYYGHNALVNIRALGSVGGLVEESNEDYKTLALLHKQGYKSIYAENAVTWEEVPPDYISSKKRSLRWSRDAVSQLALISIGSPVAIAFYLFYGWVSYMSSLAMLMFLPLMAVATIPNLFSSKFVELGGSITLAVIILWPLCAARIRDSELTMRKIISAMAWGSVYNLPMMAPNALQIVRTTGLKVWSKIKKLSIVEQEFIKEFVVTPKAVETTKSFTSILSKLRVEIIASVALLSIILMSGHLWALMFDSPQILSALSLPFLVYAESKLRKSPPMMKGSMIGVTPAHLRQYGSGTGDRDLRSGQEGVTTANKMYW